MQGNQALLGGAWCGFMRYLGSWVSSSLFFLLLPIPSAVSGEVAFLAAPKRVSAQFSLHPFYKLTSTSFLLFDPNLISLALLHNLPAVDCFNSVSLTSFFSLINRLEFTDSWECTHDFFSQFFCISYSEFEATFTCSTDTSNFKAGSVR